MRRLLVIEDKGGWTFVHDGIVEPSYPTALHAGNAAVEYGKTLRGQALGYIVRLQLSRVDEDTTTLFTEVF